MAKKEKVEAPVADVEAPVAAATEDTGPKMAKRAIGISNDAALTVLVKENVKRAGSAAATRFEGYLTDPAPATVAAALENGLTMGDIKFDLIHGFIEVAGASVEEYEVNPRGPRTAKDDSEESDAEVAVDEAAEAESF